MANFYRAFSNTILRSKPRCDDIQNHKKAKTLEPVSLVLKEKRGGKYIS